MWQFKVMPFGLTNAPATFERLMEKILGGLSWKICMVYLDDIVVFSKSFDQQLENLQQVFHRLRESKLKLSPKKCVLFQKQVIFLGHVISSEGIATEPAKIDSIRDWPVPKNVKDLRSFLGLCSYYRRFVQGFSNIAKCLHKLTEKDAIFIWEEEHQAAFEKLKYFLTTSPILACPTRVGEFILDTDASNFGAGAVLSQIQEGEERVISYFSKTFSKAQRNYCVTRRELLAIVMSVKHFHSYLYGQKFRVRTDHGALTWLMKFKNPEGQIARWIEILSTYDMTIEHRAGRLHSNADALSRRPCLVAECSCCPKKEIRLDFNYVEDHDVVCNDDSSRRSSSPLKNVNVCTAGIETEINKVTLPSDALDLSQCNNDPA